MVKSTLTSMELEVAVRRSKSNIWIKVLEHLGYRTYRVGGFRFRSLIKIWIEQLH